MAANDVPTAAPALDPPTDEHPLSRYQSASGRFEPVWTLEIQVFPHDADRIIDAVAAVNPLRYGRYERNAGISAVGSETATPPAGSTTANHVDGFEPGSVETYPMVEVKISIEPDAETLAAVMDAILYVHPYEEPVIFLRQDWVSRAAYDPDNDNPNRWWNNGRGLPERISS